MHMPVDLLANEVFASGEGVGAFLRPQRPLTGPDGWVAAQNVCTVGAVVWIETVIREIFRMRDVDSRCVLF